MAGKGRKFMLHGSYKHRAAALRKKHAVHGFVKRVKVRGHVRWTVLTRKEA